MPAVKTWHGCEGKSAPSRAGMQKEGTGQVQTGGRQREEHMWTYVMMGNRVRSCHEGGCVQCHGQE